MKSKSTLAALALATLTHSVTPARAADGTWLGTTGNWSDTATWSGDTIADGTDFTANFTGVNIAASQTITIDTPRTIGHITFTDTTTASHNLTLSGTNPLTLDVTTGAPVLNVTNQTLTISSGVAGSDGLTKSGSGQLILAGTNTSFSGPVTVSAGILTLGSTGALGGASGLTLASGTKLLPTVDGVAVTAPITLGAAGSTATINAPALGTAGGTVYTLAVNGAISGAGNLTLLGTQTNNVYGTIVLGAASDYSGSTLFTTDTSASNKNIFVKLGINNALPTTTVLTLDGNTGTGSSPGRYCALNLNGFNQTLAGLTNISRSLRVQRVYNTSATASTLTINTSGDHTFSGLLGNGGTNFGLTKSGSGTFTLSGVNTYTGATTINNGKLVGVTGGSCAPSTVTVANTTGTLGVAISDNTKVWTCANLTVAAAGVLDFNFGSITPGDTVAPLVVTNAVDFTATPAVVARGASLATLAVGAYPLMTWASVTGTVPTSVILPPTMEGNLSVTGNILYLNVTKISALPLSWAAADGAWDVNPSLNWKDSNGSASSYQENLAGAAAVVFEDLKSGAGPAITVTLPADVAPAGVTFDNSAKSFTLSGPGVITGTTGLTKIGSGTVTVAHSNTYAGATAISDGTLKLGAANCIPDGTGKGNLTVNGTLDLNTFSETVNGLSGSGTVDTVAGGAAVLTVGNANASSTFDGIIQDTAGTLALAKTGTGTLTLSGINTYSGGTGIAGGVINATHASALGTGNVTINGGTRLVIGTGLEVTNPITIGSNTGVTGRGLVEPGTTAGTATVSGPITINNLPTAGGHFAAPTAGTILDVKGVITSPVVINMRLGTVMFSGGGTGYTDLGIYQGTGMVGANNGIATSAAISIGNAAAAVLDLNGFNQSLVGITKSGSAATVGNSSTTTDSTLTTTGTSTFAGVIQDVLGTGSMKVNLTVNGGALTLSGANTYTGATTVSAGTLALGASNVLADTTAVSIGNATLDAGTSDDTIGTLGVTGTATINLGTGANLVFADSSAVAWSGGLNLTGSFVSGNPGSLRFGTTNTGLTASQLASISATGFTGFGLDADGFLTATAAGGYSAWQTANGTALPMDQDHDNDGVDNGIEYFLGGSTSTTGFTALPGVINTAGTLSVTWTKAATYTGTYGAGFVVETSSSLTGGWTPEVLGATVTLTGNGVKYTFPTGTRNFARLKVSGL